MNTKVIAIVLGVGMIGVGPFRALAADANAGKAVFTKSCVSCHGADGKGNPAMAKVMSGLDITAKEVTQRSDDELLKAIAEGKGKMPAQKSLSKDEQKQVLAYVRSLAK